MNKFGNLEKFTFLQVTFRKILQILYHQVVEDMCPVFGLNNIYSIMNECVDIYNVM